MGGFWPWEKEQIESPTVPWPFPTTDQHSQPSGDGDDDSDEEEEVPAETPQQFYYRTYVQPMQDRARGYNNLSIQEQDPSSPKYWWRHDIIKARDKDPKGSRGYSGPKSLMMNPSIMHSRRRR